MADEDIDRWIKGLAGRPGATVTPEEAVEIRRLQAAILTHALEDAESQPRTLEDEVGDRRAWQRIASELDLGASAPRSARPRRLLWPSLATAATLLIAVFFTIWRVSDSDRGLLIVQQAAPQYHGAIPVIVVKDLNPLARAKRLARHLIPLATKPTIYSRNGQATVEFELSDDHLTEVSRELTRESILVDGLAAGVVQVQFLPP
jgi:hypothetical protein